MSKLNLILHTFSITGSVAGLFLTGKELARTSKRKWREMIHIRRDQRVQMREEVLSIDWNR